MQRSILVVLSDPHGGHRHGLLNPDTILEEEDEEGTTIKDYHPQVTRIQEYLWEQYTKWIAEVKAIAGTDPLYIIVNGDITCGDKYHQLLVSSRMADQFVIAEANFWPLYDLKPRAVILIKGTGAHVFNEGTSEIVVSAMLKNKYPDISTSVKDHGLFNIGGMDVDISHHGPPPGSRKWLEGNEARYYLRSAMLDEMTAGKTPPRIYYRAHYHQEVEETLIIKGNGNRYKSTLIITPSLAFIDNHARQTVRSPSRITHGMSVAEIVDGELLRNIPLSRTIDIRSKERFD
jgi:hypothetical protein